MHKHESLRGLTVLPIIFIIALATIGGCNENGESGKIGPSIVFGADYSPGHYPDGDFRLNETENGLLTELLQLRAAGFNSVRLYQQPPKVWVPTIKTANQLVMSVIYQVAACQNHPITKVCCGPPTSNNKCPPVSPRMTITELVNREKNVLKAVIQDVTEDVFTETVNLIFVSNEKLFTCDTCANGGPGNNANDLVQAIKDIQAIADPLGIPVSFSIQGDVILKVNDPGRVELVNALEADAPIGVNIYPFQWGVPVEKAVSGENQPMSIDWYLSQLESIPEYTGHEFWIAETGWATMGTNPEYACECCTKLRKGPCDPGIQPATSFLKDLDGYVQNNNVN